MEVCRPENMGKIIIRMARIECRNQISKGAATRMLTERTKWARTGQIQGSSGFGRVRRGQRRGNAEDGFILGLERLFDILVQFAVGPSGFRGVQIASSSDMAVRGIEVERAREILELWKGQILGSQCQRTLSTRRGNQTFIVNKISKMMIVSSQGCVARTQGQGCGGQEIRRYRMRATGNQRD